MRSNNYSANNRNLKRKVKSKAKSSRRKISSHFFPSWSLFT